MNSRAEISTAGRRIHRVLRLVAVIVPLFILTMAAALPSLAHDPITTKVRFNKEVIRVLQKSCLSCHHPGGIAMSLATYDDARPWAKAIKEEVLEKRMPPWRAMKGYGDFRNSPAISQHDIDLIVNWVEGGAPKGEDKDLPAGQLFSNDWPSGKPDLVLTPREEQKISGSADEYRDIVIPTGLKENRWLAGIDLLPGNSSVVHCATFLLVTTEGSQALPTMVEGKAVESASSASAGNRPVQVLGTWMPGQTTVILDGAAQYLPAGSSVKARIHYHGSGEDGKDTSSIGLYFAKSAPKRQLKELVLTNPDAVIPKSAELHRLTISATTDTDSEAFGVRPTVNPLITSLQVTAKRPDGSEEVLVWTRGYQADWEPTYFFKQPVALPKGTRIELIAYFDNSDDNPSNPNPARPEKWSDLSAKPICSVLISPNVNPDATKPR